MGTLSDDSGNVIQLIEEAYAVRVFLNLAQQAEHFQNRFCKKV